MRAIIFISCLLLILPQLISAQTPVSDTFIRKDGIHVVPEFEEWQTETLFFPKKQKGKVERTLPLLPLDACERIKSYTSISTKKEEPYRFFRSLSDLESHDSTYYFQSVSELPSAYQSFFKGLYYVEENSFDKAIPYFDFVLKAASIDSLLQKETPFWIELSNKVKTEQTQHNTVLKAYNLFQQSRVDSVKLMYILDKVTLPQYQVHKYVCLFNFAFYKNDYKGAMILYDSVLAYSNDAKMKSSLKKNRDAVLEMLNAKQRFIEVMKKDIYHYEIDYLYDNLTAWGQDTSTDKEFVTMAGFELNKKFTSKTDTVYVRNLIDTAINGQLSKFEVLSFVRTPLDKAGRRFIIVKLAFNSDSAYSKYSTFLEKFKSKSIVQSVLYNTGNLLEGDEYMLTKFFIAALYKQNDPLVKYGLSLYLIQDAEGNVYGVDTLF